MTSTSALRPSPARWNERAPLGFCLSFGLGLVIYLPSLAGGFVWDDTALVLRDPLIRSWRLFPEAFQYFLFLDATGSDFYRPLQRVSYGLDYGLFAFSPRGYHFTSVALHGLAGGMLFLLARQIIRRFSPAGTRPFWVAFGAAATWIVHPLHTSAVTYVSGRADPLAALFCFAGLTFALVALDRPNPNWRDLAAGVSFLLAAFSKELGLIGFALWFVVLAMAKPTARRTSTTVAISAFALASYFVLRSNAEHVSPPPAAASSLTERPALMAAALGEYAGLVTAPLTLHMERGQSRANKTGPDQPVFSSPSLSTVLAGLAVAGLWVGWFIHSVRRHQRAQTLALALAAVAYLPISNILTLNATLAEHWLYLPLGFLLVAASVEFAKLVERGRRVFPGWTAMEIGLVLVWGFFLAVRTWNRQADWRDQATFFERTIADGGTAARMYINRALESGRRGDTARARADFALALERAPGQRFALLGLANLEYRAHNYETARLRLTELGNDSFIRPDALDTLALINRAEHTGDGLDEVNKALILRPGDWPLTRRKVQFLAADGRPTEAISVLRRFVAEQPFRAESWQLLADLWRDSGQSDLASEAMRRARQLDVHLVESPTK